MRKAALLTIGTEITSGEIVNSNAAWISTRLEALGVRVSSHLSVRDNPDEMMRALEFLSDVNLVVVTGGLGPTSDDCTREVLAKHFGDQLEFREAVWVALQKFYLERGLPLRDAHRHQCHFPSGAEALPNAVGTALGFFRKHKAQLFFALPGPLRELQTIWQDEVEPRLAPLIRKSPLKWVKWTCLGSPESEIAELVEPILKNSEIEVGYRAQWPYVKVKIFVDPIEDREFIERVDQALSPFIVGRGSEDLAMQFIELWPGQRLRVLDRVSETELVTRLCSASKTKKNIEIEFKIGSSSVDHEADFDLELSKQDGGFQIDLFLNQKKYSYKMTLPFKIPLDSERGRKAAAEWTMWFAVKTLRGTATPH